MPVSRRQVLIAGSSAGVAALLMGCEQAPEETVEIGAVQTPAEPAGDVELYDGSPVEPLSGEAIMNPAGLPDRPLGGVGAPVTLIEYLSPTCPHCANFNATVYPQIKAEFIDTGRITFISRPFMRNVLDAVVFLLAEAAGSGEAYYQIIETYLSTQNQWAAAQNPRDAIFTIAQQFGFTQERFEEVLTDQEMFAALESLRDQALNDFGLTGTPAFYINGQRFTGNYTYEELSAAINSRL